MAKQVFRMMSPRTNVCPSENGEYLWLSSHAAEQRRTPHVLQAHKTRSNGWKGSSRKEQKSREGKDEIKKN